MNKVMFLMDHFKDPYAGTEGQVFALIQGLNKRNIETELAVFKTSDYIDDGKFPCKIKKLNIFKMFSVNSIFKIFLFALYCRRNKYKLVHIYFNDASILAPFILWSLGIKVITSRRDMGYWYNLKLLRILRWNAKFLQGCICNCNAVKNITVDNEGIPSDKVHVVYNGMPASKIPENNDELIENQIGLVANIRTIKRIEDFIKALSLVKIEMPTASGVIVGGGDSTKLKQLAKEYGVDEYVYFVGAQENVSHYISKFHIAILCSESEGLSNGIMEYMIHKKPVICSAVGGNPELITDDEQGYLYPVGNVEQLSSLIIKILKNKELSKKMGESGRNKILAEFTIDNMIDSTIKIYKKLLKEY